MLANQQQLFFINYNDNKIGFVQIYKYDDNKSKTLIKYDSIYVKDSISIKAINDTIFIEKTKIYNRYKNIIDTVIKIDTLKETELITNEITKEVNHLKTWQMLLMIVGSISIFYIVLKLLNKIKY